MRAKLNTGFVELGACLIINQCMVKLIVIRGGIDYEARHMT